MARYAMPSPAQSPADPLRPVALCPDCGWPLLTGYRPSTTDPGDVEPSALCSRPSCGFGY